MTQDQSMPIAIIGMGCRFPGGGCSPEKLWELCAAAKSTWSEIPEARFRKDAFFHPKADHKGTFNIKGAHFLDEDVAEWDASFFNLTADMAKSMDPQVRLLLETVFEALESAGLPLEKVAGSDTSVFAGTCFFDYRDMLMRNPENLSRYFLTGNLNTFTANRISHFFDTRGPSVTVDTACSTALSALHLACQSLRTGEAKMGIVGGANLLLYPSTFVALSNLGLTGADGRSYGFDSRAEGYGRGEGVASIVIKPLKDALADGDPIRAVIRETGVNQDGKTPTITSPSPEAQEALIRDCYRRAGLDPRDTTYVEAHGTGTISGDTIEMAAIGAAIARDRGPNEPLLVGSIKANLGHLEAASGMAALIKTVKMLELGKIPPQALLQELNPRIDFNSLNLKVPRTLEPWPAGRKKRVSVCNFGAGGANTHVILDSAEEYQKEMKGLSLNDASQDRSPHRYVFSLSAKDKNGLRASANALAGYLDAFPSRYSINDLAYTLNERRSHFTWKAAVSASSINDLRFSLKETEIPLIQSLPTPPRIGFVYTGQGAQWFAMGRELIKFYPVFAASLAASAAIISRLESPWDLIKELSRDIKTTKINDPALSFPITVAIQIALTELLSSFGIQPTATTGHSSGEIAAAFAAGGLNHDEAITIAYIRGYLTSRFVQQDKVQGGMMAVGLGKEACLSFLQQLTAGKVTIACINSPNSVTVAGDLTGINEMADILQEQNVFYSKLKVLAAYHSEHMELIAFSYFLELEKYLKNQEDKALSKVIFSSPVTGGIIDSKSELGPKHWVQNMVQCVLFDDCLQNMLLPPGASHNALSKQVDILIEIGPHGALAGPIRQILALPRWSSEGIRYLSCLSRFKDAVQTIQDVAVNLYTSGTPISFRAVNNPLSQDNAQSRVIPDLPVYKWNHSNKYWAECLQVEEFCQRRCPHHDLLGVRVEGLNPETPTWRNQVRQADLPWLEDHTLEEEIVFPTSGFITMAIEGIKQLLSDSFAPPATGFRISAVEISQALIIPTTDAGISVQLSLHSVSSRELGAKQHAYEFAIFSQHASNTWKKHCSGRIMPDVEGPRQERISLSSLKPFEVSEFYTHLQKVGPTFGPAFQNVIAVNSGYQCASATIVVPDVKAMMPTSYASDCYVHPTTLEAFLQSTYAAVTKPHMLQLGLSIPVALTEMFVSSSIEASTGASFHAEVEILHLDEKGFKARVLVINSKTPDGPPVCQINNVIFKSLGLGSQTEATKSTSLNLFQTAWKPDVSFISTHYLKSFSVPGLSAGGTTSPSEVNSLSPQSDVSISDENQCTSEFHHSKYVTVLGSNCHSPTCIYSNSEMPEKYGTTISTLSVASGSSFESSHSKTSQPFSTDLDQLSELISLTAHKRPNAQVLFICGETNLIYMEHVIKGLSREDSSKLIADHLVVATSEAAVNLNVQGHEDQVDYMPIDLAYDPLSQGFMAHSFDIIITCFASSTTLSHFWELLKPQGKLILLAMRSNSGLQLATADSESDIIEKTWSQLLTKNSFSGLDATIQVSYEQSECVHSLMLTTALAGPSEDVQLADSEACKTISLVYPHSSVSSTVCDEWLKDLAEKILPGTNIPIFSLENLPSERQDYSIVLDIEQPLLQDIDERSFKSLKTLVESSNNVLWVSRGGAMDNITPTQALHSGLLRTLRLENEAKQYVSLDTDPERPQWTLATLATIHSLFQSMVDGRLREECEFEFAERKGQIFVPRLIKNFAATRRHDNILQSSTVTEGKFLSEEPHIHLERPIPGQRDTWSFVEVDKETKEQANGLHDDDVVVIRPHAFGLSSSTRVDGGVQWECAGTVSRLGLSAATQFAVGDSVMAILASCENPASDVRAHWAMVAPMPADITYEKAASIPVALATAYYALVTKAQVQSDESLLVDFNAGNTAQAAIAVAQWKQTKNLLVLVDSDEERDFLQTTYNIPVTQIFVDAHSHDLAKWILHQTQGKGVDVVLNSSSSAVLQTTFDCLAPFGRFLDIRLPMSQQNENKLLDTKSFIKSVSYFAIDMVQLARHRQVLFSQVLRAASSFIGQQISIMTPIKSLNLGNLIPQLKTLHIDSRMEKIIVNIEDDITVPIVKQNKGIQLSNDTTYLIAGGLSGIGREIAKWMARKGAKYLILLSRSAETTENDDLISILKNHGIHYAIRNCDISNSSQLREVTEEYATSWPPIRGIVQAAGLLNNSFFENITHEQWTNVLSPKVKGTANLASLLVNQETSLEFFIVFSSLTSVMGCLGQSNYSAAGTYQDALVRMLRSQGVPATCLNLGGVLETGMAVRTNDALAILKRAGYHAHPISEILSMVESIISDQHAPYPHAQIIPGISPWSQIDGLQWRREPRFTETSVTVTLSNGNNVGATTASTSSPRGLLLAAVTAAEKLAIVLNAIRTRMASIFMIDAADIKDQSLLGGYGLDSLVALELRNWLVANVSPDVTVFDITGSETPLELAQKVTVKLQ